MPQDPTALILAFFVLPLTALLLVVARNWAQFLALIGASDDMARFDLAWKGETLSPLYVAAVLGAAILFGLLRYLEELRRGLRANGGAPVPAPARIAEARDARA